MRSDFQDKLERPALSILISLMPFKTVFYFLAIIFVTLIATIGEILTISSIQPFISNITGDSADQSFLLANIFSKSTFFNTHISPANIDASLLEI